MMTKRRGASVLGLAALAVAVLGGVPACVGRSRSAAPIETSDRFNEVALRIDGISRGGAVTIRDLTGSFEFARVGSVVGESGDDVAARMAVAIRSRVPPGDPLRVRVGVDRQPLPLVRRDGARLVFQNMGIGDVYLTSSDPGLRSMPAPTGLSATRNGNLVNLRWRAVRSATGYAIFRDGVSIGRVDAPSTAYEDALRDAAGAPLSIQLNPDAVYEVLALDGDDLAGPPARSAPVDTR